MDKAEKRLTKMAKQLVDIERALKRIEKIVVHIYEHRYSEPYNQSRSPPRIRT